MCKQLTIFFLLLVQSSLFLPVELAAQKISYRPVYRLVDIEQVGDSVDVSFELFVPKRGLKRNSSMTMRPLLSSGHHEIALPIVKVYTRHSFLLDRKRKLFNKKTVEDLPVMFSVASGTPLNYRHRLAHESWMDSTVSLTNRTTIQGCCNRVEAPISTLLSDFSLTHSSSEADLLVSATVPVESIPTSVEVLQDKYTAVSDISEYVPGKVKREGSIMIYFDQGSSTIDFQNPANMLSLAILREIANISRTNTSVDLKKVKITGSASIEGNYDMNLALSQRRAESLRQYMSHLMNLSSDILEITYKGEDWDGLYTMVQASDMRDKQAVLDIIDNIPYFLGREKALMDLRGGVPYLYMAKYFFPSFRKAGSVHFYYQEKE